MRRRDLSRVLDIDAAAFSAFWRLDRMAFEDARTATPSCRRRVVSVGGPTRRKVVGYAVTGRSGDQGYLQRLAVDPDQQGRGIGRMLLDDALHWLAHHGATTVLVNTQPDNDPALDLYRSAGFTDRPGGLSVLRLESRSS
jgi:mycothiol synthase